MESGHFANRPTLLGVPLEIRQKIYEETLIFPARDQLALLGTCKELLAETKEFLYRRPLIFKSQNSLFTFMQRADKPLLNRLATTLKIRILNISVDDARPWLSSIVEGTRLFDSPGHPLQEECDRITEALEHLSSIEDMTIYKAIGVDDSPPCDLYEGLFRWIKNNYTLLRKLTLEIHTMPLSFLPPLKALRSLHFTGFSVSTPETTLKVLNALPSLKELKISGPPPGLSVSQRSGWARLDVTQSFTPTVLRGLRSLKSISICEVLDPSRSGFPVFISPEMLEALRLQHASTLQKLELTTNIELSANIVPGVVALFENSASMTHLRIGWPNMHLHLLDHIPKIIKTIELPVSWGLDPVAVAQKLLSRGRALKRLTSVTFGVWSAGTILDVPAAPLVGGEALERYVRTMPI